MDKNSQTREMYKTAGRDDDIKRNVRTKNITTPVQEETCNSIDMVDNQIYSSQGNVNNSMIMVDNPIYSSSTDTNDDIFIVDNELYASEIKNNDSSVMVDNDIYVAFGATYKLMLLVLKSLTVR